jgi:hypothetical protein
MLQHPSAGTRGDTLPDWVTEALAKSEAQQAKQAEATPEQAHATAERYRIEHENYLRLTVDKRAQGDGDCSHEADLAAQQAVTTARQHVAWRPLLR